MSGHRQLPSHTPELSFWERLTRSVQTRQSLLCVGLDPHPAHMPARYARGQADSLAACLAWNRGIIQDTAPWACAFKPNLAFYLRHGGPGLALLQDTLAAIPPDIPVILDAKFGDIAATAQAYAAFCFEELGVDAVTLNPLLGRDSAAPFLAYADRGHFLLVHTSNPDAAQLQQRQLEDVPLYLYLARAIRQWHPQTGLVVGATYPGILRNVRRQVPNAWILVPGVGRQGGDLAQSVRAGWCEPHRPGILINVSSRIASAPDHAQAARSLVQEMRAVMADIAAEAS